MFSHSDAVQKAKKEEQQSAYLRSYLEAGPNGAHAAADSSGSSTDDCEVEWSARRAAEVALLDAYAPLDYMNERED
jgi:hypothetical protein